MPINFSELVDRIDQRNLQNRQQMVARMLVCMGGTVAEELIFGRDQVTSGATDDLRQVKLPHCGS